MAHMKSLKILGALLGGVGVLLACTPEKRDFDEILERGGSAGSAGELSSAGTANLAGEAGDHAGMAGAAGHSGASGNGGTAGTTGATTGGSSAASGASSTSGGASSTSGGASSTSGGASSTSGGTSSGTGGTSGAAAGGDSGAGGASCVPTETTESTCDDNLDNDCNGRTDCDDIERCSTLPLCCVATQDTETLCDNATDDDCDGLRDCADSDCEGQPTCAPACESTATNESAACNDGVDNDCDGLTDCEDDSDCALATECLPACVPIATAEDENAGANCSDSLDDDCDGFVDCADSDCAATSACAPACTPTTEDCNTAEDEDCDGFAGCADGGCISVAPCCDVNNTGPEICNDGINNNCDSFVDCPVIENAFPAIPAQTRFNWEGGAAAGDDVRIQLEPPFAGLGDYVVQCRTGKPGTIAIKNFQVCNPADPSSLDVVPVDSTYANDPANNGLTVTQIRYAFLNGSYSDWTATRPYYVHNSLVGAPFCPDKATDLEYFQAAAPYLGGTTAPLFAHAEARLANPFVNIDFAPPVSATFTISDTDGPEEILSLRRRFILDPDRHMILMKRVYASRRADARRCLAALIRKHDSNYIDFKNQHFNGCDALVINKAGAGVCLAVDLNGLAVFPIPFQTTSLWASQYSGEFPLRLVDHFIWRKLLKRNTNGEIRLFSPKCYAPETCADSDSNILFLPDRSLFTL